MLFGELIRLDTAFSRTLAKLRARAGQQVAALMGGMGRVFDGGAAAHTDMEQNRVSGKLVVTT